MNICKIREIIPGGMFWIFFIEGFGTGSGSPNTSLLNLFLLILFCLYVYHLFIFFILQNESVMEWKFRTCFSIGLAMVFPIRWNCVLFDRFVSLISLWTVFVSFHFSSFLKSNPFIYFIHFHLHSLTLATRSLYFTLAFFQTQSQFVTDLTSN